MSRNLLVGSVVFPQVLQVPWHVTVLLPVKDMVASFVVVIITVGSTLGSCSIMHPFYS